jgi:hypothetical protein
MKLAPLVVMLLPAFGHAETLDPEPPAAGSGTVDMRLAADLGLGSLHVAGRRITAVTGAINFDGDVRISPHLAIGVRVAKSLGIQPTVVVIPPPIGPAVLPAPNGPWRDIPWLAEPELVARATPLRGRSYELALIASAGLGISRVDSQVLCAECVEMGYRPEHHLEPSGSALVGAQLAVLHVELFAGIRVTANGAGDVGGAADAGLGATW